ncbi:MAG: class I SAM-dependent methyltransferase [Chloroflexi bacterium]|nr:class I SAM-dependent methyltransferase [Chloroflexota bacterium]
MNTSWELLRDWEIIRYLVYYLIEDFVHAHLIPGKDVLDFSAGLGDLSTYIAQNQPKSLIATAPEDIEPAPALLALQEVTFLSNLPAIEISSKLPPNSVDLFLARMVFQFPTDEADRIDIDGMLAQIYTVLRPGGRIIIASHEYTELDDHPDDWNLALEDYLREVVADRSGRHKTHLKGLIELIRAIGLPPREGIHGQTGFGLKSLMAVDSFVQAGFTIEDSAEIEDFTFPVGLTSQLLDRKDYYRDLGEKIMAIKRAHILTPEFEGKYTRPQVLQSILREINQLHSFVTIPIFRIQARKPG